MAKFTGKQNGQKTPQETKRCVSWVAVSSEEQARQSSPADQRADNLEFINRTLPLTYGVQGALVTELEIHDSRSIIELSEAAATYPDIYGRLQQLIKDRAFDILVCRSADRLGRSRSLISTIEELCEAAGILIVCVKEGLPATLDAADYEGSSYVAANRGASAKEEIKRLKGRRDRGMKRKVQKGEFPAAVPFGYRRLPNGAIAIDEPAAATIRRFVELYLAGNGTQAIANALNEEGKPAPRGGTWTFGSIGVLLDRIDRYAGWVEFNKDAQPGKEHVRARGDYPQIISDEELTAILSERADRAKRPIRRRHVFTGVCFCVGCGKPLAYHSYRRRNAAGEWALVQTLRCHRRYCAQRVEVRIPIVAEALVSLLVAMAGTAKRDLKTFVGTATIDSAAIDTQIAGTETAIARHQESRRRILHAYTRLMTLDEDEYMQQTAQVDRQIRNAEDQLASLHEQRQAADDAAGRLARAEEIQRRADVTIGKIMAEDVTVNQHLRQSFEVWVKPGSRYDDRIERIVVL